MISTKRIITHHCVPLVILINKHEYSFKDYYDIILRNIYYHLQILLPKINRCEHVMRPCDHETEVNDISASKQLFQLIIGYVTYSSMFKLWDMNYLRSSHIISTEITAHLMTVTKQWIPEEVESDTEKEVHDVR